MNTMPGYKEEANSFMDDSYASDMDEPEDSESQLARKKRSLNIPGYDPYIELLKFRDGHYMTREEETKAISDHYKQEIVIMRMVTPSLTDLDQGELRRENADGTATPARELADNLTLAAVQEAITVKGANGMAMSDFLAPEGSFVTGLQSIDELDKLNRTQYRVDMMFFIMGSGADAIKALNRDFYKGILSSTFNITDVFIQDYTPVDEKTVFQATIRLASLPFMPQFTDLNNTATLKVTNALTLLTRPMFRYCFGEFFFRSVVMDYWSGPLLGDTIVFMAFLLEASEYNVVDVDTVWKRQAATGILGEYPIDLESFVVYDVQYVPTHFKQFLVAEVTRQERVLDTVEFLMAVGVPSFFGMLTLFFVINICAWEGFFCKLVFEDEPVCGCCRKNDDEEEDDAMPEKVVAADYGKLEGQA